MNRHFEVAHKVIGQITFNLVDDESSTVLAQVYATPYKADFISNPDGLRLTPDERLFAIMEVKKTMKI